MTVHHGLHTTFSHLHGLAGFCHSPKDLENIKHLLSGQGRRLFATGHDGGDTGCHGTPWMSLSGAAATGHRVRHYMHTADRTLEICTRSRCTTAAAGNWFQRFCTRSPCFEVSLLYYRRPLLQCAKTAAARPFRAAQAALRGAETCW